MRSQVQLGICIRPLVENEVKNGGKTAVEIVGGRLCFHNSISPTGYDFEHMFGPSNRQIESVYDTLVRPLVDHIFQGFTATVFAYGQTGSGKTYLMGSSLPQSSLTGESDQENGQGASVEIGANLGIIPMSLYDIFKKKKQLEAEGATVELEMSYLEIYQEECYDLLSAQNISTKDDGKENRYKVSLKEKSSKGKNVNLEMRENTKGETALDGLTSWPVANYSEVTRLLAAAAGSRATGKTAMNARSSRSHAIATFSLRITMNSDKISSIFSPSRGASTTIMTSKLHLVDLAGSEKVGKTLATGECLKEGVSINKGLLTLGKVVSALNEQQLQSSNTNTHIPYRESKLTRLLKDALGGHGMTVMLACCSPADLQFKETVDTLRFATRASAIVNNAKQNLDKIMEDLPPFVCYNCGASNPCDADAAKGTKRVRDEIPPKKPNDKYGILSPITNLKPGMLYTNFGDEEDKENLPAQGSDPFFYQKGHKMVLLSTNKYSLSPALVKVRSPQGNKLSTSPTRPPCYPPVPEILTECILQTNLDSKSSEVIMLEKKLQLAETDRLVAEARFSTLQVKYLQSQKDQGQKVKKRKTVIQRVVAAVGCTVNSGEVYSPKGKQNNTMAV